MFDLSIFLLYPDNVQSFGINRFEIRMGLTVTWH